MTLDAQERHVRIKHKWLELELLIIYTYISANSADSGYDIVRWQE